MPTTRKPTLADVLKPFAKFSTVSLDNVACKVQSTDVALSASSAQDVAVFHAKGISYVKRIVFIPEVAIASHSSNKWTLTIINKGTDGSGSTTLGTFTTYGSAVVAYDAKTLYAPTAGEIEIASGAVIAITCTKAASPADLRGRFDVEYEDVIG